MQNDFLNSCFSIACVNYYNSKHYRRTYYYGNNRYAKILVLTLHVLITIILNTKEGPTTMATTGMQYDFINSCFNLAFVNYYDSKQSVTPLFLLLTITTHHAHHLMLH